MSASRETISHPQWSLENEILHPEKRERENHFQKERERERERESALDYNG